MYTSTIRQLWFDRPLEAMELEVYADFAEETYQAGRWDQGRADIVVYDERYGE